MAILKSIGDVFGSKTKEPTASIGNTDLIFDLAFNNPQLMEIFSLSFQLGQSPSDLIAPFIETGSASGDPLKLDLGGGKFLNMDKLSSAIPNLKADLETKAIANFETTFQKLSSVPALSGIFSEAMGDTSAFNAKFGAVFDALAGAALGSAAPSGMLHDPLKQANVLGPTALNKAMFEQQLQQNSLAQALSLSGAGLLPGVNPNAGLGTSAGMLQFQPGVFNAAQLGLSKSVAQGNFSLAAQQLQFMKEKEVDAALWKASSAIAGGFGGGGGGGAMGNIGGSGQFMGGQYAAGYPG